MRTIEEREKRKTNKVIKGRKAKKKKIPMQQNTAGRREDNRAN